MRLVSLLVASTAMIMPAYAFAQSTGSIDFEEDAIVVTGSRASDVAGVLTPDTSKPRQVLTQELIARQNPGQSILDTINVIPGVSFQNNDAYGSSGGTISIRGFPGDRISLTFDGIPLNDSGNYAIYSNQQLDPELIEQVNVSRGSTDVDSPTASAVGGTINYRTRIPGEDVGGMVSASYGEFDFHRVFGMIDTGNLTSFGTRAFVAASKASNDNPFNNYSEVDKQQYNARIYQPLGVEGDFLSLAGNYNQNRNNFFGSLPLRLDRPNPGGGFPTSNDDREYDINYPCNTNQVARPGQADNPNSCGVEFERRYNPSNTGSLRGGSRFTFADSITLSVDPSYQYVKANGGGTVRGNEGFRDINPAGGTGVCAAPITSAAQSCRVGYLSGQPYFGRDLNGDGDTLDVITVIAPSQTQTHRYGVIANLAWEINDFHSLRASYTFDRARHRQTGQVGPIDIGGEPIDVFPVNDPLADASGSILQKRDRLSYATLHQVAGQYRGEFFDERLTVDLGLRAPFFKRDLNQNCFTTSASGFVECFGTNEATETEFAALNPTRQGPQQRVFKYDDVLPSVGAVFDFTPRISAFASYAKGLSVPGTDNLYNSFFFAPDTEQARPDPETTDTVDGGVRYRSARVQAELAGFYTKYKNRQASAFDPELNETVFRNLGTVEKYGVDGYISYQPIPQLQLYAFGSYLESEIQDDVQVGVIGGVPQFAPTAGKREAGAPEYTYGGTVRGTLGSFDLGVTAKRTGPRNIYDTNLPVFGGTTAASTILFPAEAPAYWLVNLDARASLADFGLEETYVQLNVYNLFDEFYVGGFGGGLSQSINSSGSFGSAPFVQIGAPRTISGTLVIGF